MISFTVGTTFLTDWLLGQRGHEPDARLRDALQKLRGKQYFKDTTDGKLRARCVYELFDAFFQDLRPILANELSEHLTALNDELHQTGSEAYFHPSFRATQKHAENWLAIHGLHPHGQIMRGSADARDVFLPDFANRVEFYCYFSGFGLRPRNLEDDDRTILELFEERAFQERKDQLRVHLCDSLHSVYSRVSDVAEELRVAYARTGRTDVRHFRPGAGEDQLLILDAHVGGFPAYRSLRRDFTSIPPVGGHRLLVASAIRQGLGMPVISATFSHDLWSPLPDPVRHFVLTAAEQVGKSRCEPLYPNVPPRERLQAVYSELACGFVGNKKLDDPGYTPALKMLGFGDVLSKRQAKHNHRVELGSYADDWIDVGKELLTAIYGDDIEQSLQLREVLELYPLHKRVLGLLEYRLRPLLPGSNQFAERLRCAFQNRPHRAMPPLLSEQADSDAASLAIGGGWVAFSRDSSKTIITQSGPVSGCCLAELIDALIGRVNLRFCPPKKKLACAGVNPQELITAKRQAEQLAFLETSTPEARRSLQSLSNIVVNLRNFIEHGIDEVDGSNLVVTNSEFWPMFRWMSNNLPKWRDRDPPYHTGLPGDGSGKVAIPDAATRLVLSPQSLSRCLVLTALVLHGVQSHLNVKY